MSDSPHYTLLSESGKFAEPGRWRFVLRMAGGSEPVAVDDVEPEVRGERLELLAVVRGLEALDQPSRVTLVTSSSYVHKGFRHGLPEWRRNGWQWEYYGEMVPVKNGDLWQRVDRAMRFHRVDCRSLRIDPPHRLPPLPGGGRRWRRFQPAADGQAAANTTGEKPASLRRVDLAHDRRPGTAPARSASQGRSLVRHLHFKLVGVASFQTASALVRRALGALWTFARGRCDFPPIPPTKG
jgi:ribonuclease HI